MISLSSKRKLLRDFNFQPADVEGTLAAAQTCSNSTFLQKKIIQKVITIFSDIGGKFICPKPWSYQSKHINLMAFIVSDVENHGAINLNA